MSECRVVDLKELGVSKEAFDKIYSMGEQDGRADKEKEIIENSIFFSNQPIEDIVLEARADAIDDVERELLKNGFIATHHALDVWHEIAEQLKEQNEIS